MGGMENTGESKRTPLYPVYSERSEAKLVPFRGWLLPLHFEKGILSEHHTVRNHAGLFDVSHMGEIEVSGTGSTAYLDWSCTNDIDSLEPGRARYTPMCREDGGTLDDVIVYRTGESSYLLVTNAGNTRKILGLLERRAEEEGFDASVRDVSGENALLALQGPKAGSILSGLTGAPIGELSPFHFLSGTLRGAGKEDIPCLISRTGYTGEDGFEIFTEPRYAANLWKALIEEGRDKGIEPCGLGARDTLRLEAGFPLYGHELDETVSPVEAGLEKFIDFDGADFVGREVLTRQREGHIERKRCGLRLIDQGMPRKGQRVLSGGEEIGFVTSGTRSPTRGSFIAMAYLDTRFSSPGKRVILDVNGREKRAEVVDLPFYKSTKHFT